MYINLQTLHGLIASAVDAGVQNYIRTTQPGQDRIKLAEAKRYVQRLGHQPVMIKRMIKAQLIHPDKNGQRNAAVWISLSELKAALATIKLHNVCNLPDPNEQQPN